MNDLKAKTPKNKGWRLPEKIKVVFETGICSL
jgi:hypothetical protein